MSSIKPPEFATRLKESRALFDIGRAGLSLLRSADDDGIKASASALPIMLFPGFASGPKALWPMQTYLQRLGYQVEDWGLGVNLAGSNISHQLEDLHPRWGLTLDDPDAPDVYRGEAGVPLLCDKAIEYTRKRSETLETKLVLVGWSLGGYVAREVARELKDHVAQVVTMGAPVIGGPKYTAVSTLFKARGFDLDWMEREIAKRDVQAIEQPITAIYSQTDGIVAWQASIDNASPNVNHVEVDVSHLGMGFNQQVWRIVARALHAYPSAR